MNTRQTEKKVNAIVDEILDEDQENDFGATQTEICPGGCEKLNDTSKEETQDPRKSLSPQISGQCKCGVENSSRFSLRVMEAMRSLQRDIDQPTSTAEEITDYIRLHYRHDGDLYAQVRTALRQVCSQGFVMELLSNEYHLVGPVVSPTKRNGCALGCEGRTIDDALRRRRTIDDRRNDVCGCQDPRSLREKSPRTSIVERLEEPIFHSTRISADERDNDADRRDREFNADVSDRRRRDTVGMERRDDYVEPIPGPSRRFTETPWPTPARNAKRVRVDDRGVRRADEKDDETTTEEDMDCTCDAEVVTRDEHSRIRPVDRSRVVVRNGRRRNDVEEDEEKRMEREDEEDEGERMAEEDMEDEDMEEDSAYEELRVRAPRRRTTARERELKRWIRRCRRECERRRGR